MRQEAGDRRWDTGDGRQAREGVKRQETGDMGKTGDRRRETGDRRRETGDHALMSKAGVRKSNFCFFQLKNCNSLIFHRIQLLKVSSERRDLEPFFKNFKGVRSYTYRGLISILENENDECTKLDASRGNFVHPPF